MDLIGYTGIVVSVDCSGAGEMMGGEGEERRKEGEGREERRKEKERRGEEKRGIEEKRGGSGR